MRIHLPVAALWLGLTCVSSQRLAAQSADGAATPDSIARKHRLTVGAGYGDLKSLDEAGSPLVYAVIGAPLFGSYEYRGERTVHRVTLTSQVSLVNSLPLHDRFTSTRDNRKAYFVREDLSYSVLKNVLALNSRYEVMAGGTLWLNAFLRRYQYSGKSLSASGGSGSGEGLAALCAEVNVSHDLGTGGRLNASASLPIIAYVVRPPYGIYDPTYSPLVTWSQHVSLIGQFLGWRVEGAYEREISAYFVASLWLSNSYYRFAANAWHTASLSSAAGFAVTWRFHL